MAGADRTPYQDNIIKRYYENLDNIMLQKLQELVTDLYLSEGKKRERIWKRIETALKKIKVPDEIVEHIVQQDNPELLAKFIQKKL